MSFRSVIDWLVAIWSCLAGWLADGSLVGWLLNFQLAPDSFVEVGHAASLARPGGVVWLLCGTLMPLMTGALLSEHVIKCEYLFLSLLGSRCDEG